jgi:hypothetical protein
MRQVQAADAPLVRVESAEEQYAYMVARFGDPATWSVASQQFDTLPDGREVERVDTALATGETVTVRFVAVREDSVFEDASRVDTTQFLDRVMESAATFSRDNPPHHPGTMVRFPVPSASYASAIALPLPVLAVDDGVPGLYAPPRVVVIDYGSLEVRGVGEFPGFDPDDWPPARLGDWPPPSIGAMHRQQLQGTIMRFSALWKRVLDAWFEQEQPDPAVLAGEIAEALKWRARLDLPAMDTWYDRLNPVFARWLTRQVAGSGY